VRIFVAGASGAIGRPLIAQLVAGGHEVTGMTRRPERAEEIDAAGATGVVCDVFDAPALTRAVAAARPEVVIHQLTALPQALDLRKPDVYDATNRVRREGTANLIAAAREAGTGRIVAQGISFVYAPTGGWVKTEEDPVISAAPGPFGGAMEAIMDLERQVTTAEGMDGLVLRYGFFYGPGTAFARGGFYEGELNRRRLPVIGRGKGMSSFIHVDDAAAATVAAAARGEPGIYNVVDDDPAPAREWIPALAEALGAKRPLRVPAWLARLVAGKAVVSLATTTRGASNAKAKRELGWDPLHSSWRQGFREAPL
jgi:2-alkyl-3-oxoalkanoate reductase